MVCNNFYFSGICVYFVLSRPWTALSIAWFCFRYSDELNEKYVFLLPSFMRRYDSNWTLLWFVTDFILCHFVFLSFIIISHSVIVFGAFEEPTYPSPKKSCLKFGHKKSKFFRYNRSPYSPKLKISHVHNRSNNPDWASVLTKNR